MSYWFYISHIEIVIIQIIFNEIIINDFKFHCVYTFGPGEWLSFRHSGLRHLKEEF